MFKNGVSKRVCYGNHDDYSIQKKKINSDSFMFLGNKGGHLYMYGCIYVLF